MGRDPTETPLSNFGERRFISSRSNTCFVNPETNEISLVHLKPSHLNRFLSEIDLLVLQKCPFTYLCSLEGNLVHCKGMYGNFDEKPVRS